MSVEMELDSGLRADTRLLASMLGQTLVRQVGPELLELVERVRRSAKAQGRSMNDYVTSVLDAATDPDLAGGDAARLRERLARAGLVAPVGSSRKRPTPEQVAAARAAASGGTPLALLVEEAR